MKLFKSSKSCYFGMWGGGIEIISVITSLQVIKLHLRSKSSESSVINYRSLIKNYLITVEDEELCMRR